jgi:hypothetical protein
MAECEKSIKEGKVCIGMQCCRRRIRKRTVRVIKSRRMKWSVQLALMGEKRSAFLVLV